MLKVILDIQIICIWQYVKMLFFYEFLFISLSERACVRRELKIFQLHNAPAPGTRSWPGESERKYELDLLKNKNEKARRAEVD